jgi:hypothetical protein
MYKKPNPINSEIITEVLNLLYLSSIEEIFYLQMEAFPYITTSP